MGIFVLYRLDRLVMKIEICAINMFSDILIFFCFREEEVYSTAVPPTLREVSMLQNVLCLSATNLVALLDPFYIFALLIHFLHTLNPNVFWPVM